VTAFSAAASSFGNVGPGLGEIGPSGDYLALGRIARAVTMVQMLLGRLEIYPVILALSVVTLRRRLRTRAS
jgi:trk system potassium uptake protein